MITAGTGSGIHSFAPRLVLLVLAPVVCLHEAFFAFPPSLLLKAGERQLSIRVRAAVLTIWANEFKCCFEIRPGVDIVACERGNDEYYEAWLHFTHA